jgi:hypothetical protein
MNQRLKELNKCMRALDSQDQQAVLDFASFLRQKTRPDESAKIVALVEEHPRPQNETVIGAMKRLRQTYHMLEIDDLLNSASALMGQHILQGKDANSVIDELQAIFEVQYELYKNE